MLTHRRGPLSYYPFICCGFSTPLVLFLFDSQMSNYLLMMTFGQLRLVCVKFMNDSAADLDLVDESIQGRYQRILDAFAWKGLERGATIQTTLGTKGVPAIYPLPPDLKILLEVLNSGFPFRPYSQAELDLVYPGRPDVAGVGGAPQPFIFSMASDTTATPPLRAVELYPIPGGAASYPIRYTANSPNFDPTDTIAFPLPWVPPHVIINGVRADICAAAKNYAGLEAFENLFTSGINEMLRVEIHRQPNSRMPELVRYEGAAVASPPPK
jgi:hypothetical protein